MAVGVATREEELLLAELHDPEAGETFYRPPGGGIAFGEASEETLAREFAEELDVTLADRRLVWRERSELTEKTVYPAELPALVAEAEAIPGRHG